MVIVRLEVRLGDLDEIDPQLGVVVVFRHCFSLFISLDPGGHLIEEDTLLRRTPYSNTLLVRKIIRTDYPKY